MNRDAFLEDRDSLAGLAEFQAEYIADHDHEKFLPSWTEAGGHLIAKE